MPAFSTRAEALETLGAVRDCAERLPVAGMYDLEVVSAAITRLSYVIGSAPLVDPHEAAGAHRYRQVHQLQPIEEQ